MRKIFPYTGVDGVTTYKVRFKLDGRTRSKTFGDIEDAEQFDVMLDRWGAKRTLEYLGEAVEPKRKASGATVRNCVDTYISLVPSEATKNEYIFWRERQIDPSIGSIRVNQLTHEEVQRWLNAQPQAAATLTRSLTLLSASLRGAVRRGEIAKNPADDVKIPRRAKNKKRQALDPPYTKEEVELIIKSITPHYKLMVEFISASGCRLGEAAGLQPADINLGTGRVHFQNSYSYRRGIGWKLGPVKSEESDRVIRVKQSLLEQLDLSNEFVFTTMQEGGAVKHDAFRRFHWRRALKDSGLPSNRWGHPHDLRHAHATWLLSNGVSINAVQKRLGHASAMTTLTLYGHAAADSEDQILSILD